MIFLEDDDKRLFLDIETIPDPNYSERTWDLFCKRFKREISEMEPLVTSSGPGTMVNVTPAAQLLWQDKAAFHAEFNKVICVSIGSVKQNILRIKTIFGDNEKEILLEVEKFFLKATKAITHNGKKFDLPILSRKFLMHGLRLPGIMNIYGKKMWETHWIDTMEIWAMNDYKHNISLDLLCNSLGIASSKDGMDGSQVAEIWKTNPQRVGTYCSEDVVALVNVWRKFELKEILGPDRIMSTFVEKI